MRRSRLSNYLRNGVSAVTRRLSLPTVQKPNVNIKPKRLTRSLNGRRRLNASPLNASPLNASPLNASPPTPINTTAEKNEAIDNAKYASEEAQRQSVSAISFGNEINTIARDTISIVNHDSNYNRGTKADEYLDGAIQCCKAASKAVADAENAKATAKEAGASDTELAEVQLYVNNALRSEKNAVVATTAAAEDAIWANIPLEHWIDTETERISFCKTLDMRKKEWAEKYTKQKNIDQIVDDAMHDALVKRDQIIYSIIANPTVGNRSIKKARKNRKTRKNRKSRK